MRDVVRRRRRGPGRADEQRHLQRHRAARAAAGDVPAARRRDRPRRAGRRHQRHQRGGPRRRRRSQHGRRSRWPRRWSREVPLRDGQTLATRLGAWPEWLLAAVALVAVARRRAAPAPGPGVRRRAEPTGDVTWRRTAGCRRTVARGAGVLVVIPTYNEADNIEPTRRAAARRGAGGARPGRRRQQPGRHRRARRRRWPRPTRQVHVLHRAGKEGLGRAYLAGFGWGLERGYDVLVEMDADGSHQPEELPAAARRARPAPTWCSARAGCPADGRELADAPPSCSPAAATPTSGWCSASPAATRPAASAPSGAPPWRGSTSTASPARATASRSTWPGAPCRRASASSRCRSRSSSGSAATRKMSGDIVREALWRVTVWGVAHRRTDRLRGGCRRRRG